MDWNTASRDNCQDLLLFSCFMDAVFETDCAQESGWEICQTCLKDVFDRKENTTSK
jgi:hypothetical protein